MSDSLHVRALSAWVIVCVVWGTTYLSNDLAIASIPPFRYASLRFLSAGIIVFLAARWYAGDDGTSVRDIVLHPTARAGMLTLGIGVGANIWALQWLPTGVAAVLVAGVPLYMVLVDRFVFDGARLRPAVGLGLALGLTGIALIAMEQSGDPSAAEASLIAVAGVIAGGISWAFGSVMIRYTSPPADLASTAGAQMLWAGALQGAVSLVVGETLTEPVTLLSGGAAVYSVLIGSCIAYSAYLYALRHLSVAFVSTYVFVNPVIALWLGWLLLDETMTMQTVAASAVILAGLALTRFRSRSRKT
ncbi:hypothetical protein CRI94_15660 [Longibacter salinarum]|uniref:EamA domain-containing protein n=1 Tax=Longibacter salinarum TaxID=1850348 RepID=A0A2A8CUN8_9BACT|nr:EamA family transporter [Longibacter salinarum]PEN11467.1 hypothetical protein CRI94_15660 [Longibacter salinarum]